MKKNQFSTWYVSIQADDFRKIKGRGKVRIIIVANNNYFNESSFPFEMCLQKYKTNYVIIDFI